MENTIGVSNKFKSLDFLSKREKQLIILVELGLSNKAIAYELALTEGTVKEYMNKLRKKTGLNRIELAVRSFAFRKGLALVD